MKLSDLNNVQGDNWCIRYKKNEDFKAGWIWVSYASFGDLVLGLLVRRPSITGYLQRAMEKLKILFFLFLLAGCGAISYTPSITHEHKICDSVYVLPLVTVIKNIHSERKMDWDLDSQTIERYNSYTNRYLKNKLSPHFNVSSSVITLDQNELYLTLNKIIDDLKENSFKEYLIDNRNLKLNSDGYAICLLSDWSNKDRRFFNSLYPYFGYQGSLIPQACEIQTHLFVFKIYTGELVFYSSNYTTASKGMDTDLELINQWKFFYRKVNGSINPLLTLFIKKNSCFYKRIRCDKLQFDLRGRLQN